MSYDYSVLVTLIADPLMANIFTTFVLFENAHTEIEKCLVEKHILITNLFQNVTGT